MQKYISLEAVRMITSKIGLKDGSLDSSWQPQRQSFNLDIEWCIIGSGIFASFQQTNVSLVALPLEYGSDMQRASTMIWYYIVHTDGRCSLEGNIRGGAWWGIEMMPAAKLSTYVYELYQYKRTHFKSSSAAMGALVTKAQAYRGWSGLIWQINI